MAHLDIALVQKGDVVLGTLPINLVAEVNERGGQYFHLTLELPANLRGQELTSELMRQYGARLEGYNAQRVTTCIR